MSDDGGLSIRESSLNTGPIESPGGELLFSGDARCPSCGALILSDIHRTFIFYHSPADIEHASTCGGVPSEWRPNPDHPDIPGDEGPNRVGYWSNSGATVQVHEGPDAGQWAPCSSYTVAREGEPYSMWLCRREHVEDPCDDDFMREIST